jgi:hypothetical protein
MVGAPDGGQVAAIITSTGAHGLRLGLVVDAMPDAAELRLYRKDRSKTGFETTGRPSTRPLRATVAPTATPGRLASGGPRPGRR